MEFESEDTARRGRASTHQDGRDPRGRGVFRARDGECECERQWEGG